MVNRVHNKPVRQIKIRHFPERTGQHKEAGNLPSKGDNLRLRIQRQVEGVGLMDSRDITLLNRPETILPLTGHPNKRLHPEPSPNKDPPTREPPRPNPWPHRHRQVPKQLLTAHNRAIGQIPVHRIDFLSTDWG